MSTNRKIEDLLNDFASGHLAKEDVIKRLRESLYAELEHTKLDIDRQARNGQAEVIFGENKSAQQIVEIIRSMQEQNIPVLATRIAADKAELVLSEMPGLHYCSTSETLSLQEDLSIYERAMAGNVVIVTAGTSDLKVAMEARKTLQVMGHKTTLISDVGVAGIHRLVPRLGDIQKADVAIVIAGMEGALASVVGGIVDVPIIAVPTSVGYGANFGGLSALLGMLTSCAGGITVVNIDNGFGAASAAIRIVNKLKTK
jgi:NCAIR mutase (PurE)-related protein